MDSPHGPHLVALVCLCVCLRKVETSFCRPPTSLAPHFCTVHEGGGREGGVWARAWWHIWLLHNGWGGQCVPLTVGRNRKAAERQSEPTKADISNLVGASLLGI